MWLGVIFKMGHQNDMHSREIELCEPFIGLLVYFIGGAIYDYLLRTVIFTLIMNKIFI